MASSVSRTATHRHRGVVADGGANIKRHRLPSTYRIHAVRRWGAVLTNSKEGEMMLGLEFRRRRRPSGGWPRDFSVPSAPQQHGLPSAFRISALIAGRCRLRHPAGSRFGTGAGVIARASAADHFRDTYRLVNPGVRQGRDRRDSLRPSRQQRPRLPFRPSRKNGTSTRNRRIAAAVAGSPDRRAGRGEDRPIAPPSGGGVSGPRHKQKGGA